KRPLQDLADFPIEALAETHDLVVIDHPSVGACAASRCFLPLDEALSAESLAILAEQSAGRSHWSYQYQGHQWALAIDAASECRFANIPTSEGGVPRGAILGGTGLAISSKCQDPQIAVDYALYVSSAECQRTLYFESGGQPANILAWRDPAVNRV